LRNNLTLDLVPNGAARILRIFMAVARCWASQWAASALRAVVPTNVAGTGNILPTGDGAFIGFPDCRRAA
jgi:hypothetical protein